MATVTCGRILGASRDQTRGRVVGLVLGAVDADASVVGIVGLAGFVGVVGFVVGAVAAAAAPGRRTFSPGIDACEMKNVPPSPRELGVSASTAPSSCAN